MLFCMLCMVVFCQSVLLKRDDDDDALVSVKIRGKNCTLLVYYNSFLKFYFVFLSLVYLV